MILVAEQHGLAAFIVEAAEAEGGVGRHRRPEHPDRSVRACRLERHANRQLVEAVVFGSKYSRDVHAIVALCFGQLPRGNNRRFGEVAAHDFVLLRQLGRKSFLPQIARMPSRTAAPFGLGGVVQEGWRRNSSIPGQSLFLHDSCSFSSSAADSTASPN